GISVANSRQQAESGIRMAFDLSREKRIVIEEFLDGTRHGFSALIKNKKIVFHFSDNEHYYLNPFMVSAASTPSIAGENAINQLISESEKIASRLQLVDGIFHIQFILKDGAPVIIEICRRPPGDLYINLVTLATGMDYPAQIVRAATGQAIEIGEDNKPSGYFVRHCIMSDTPGKVTAVKIDPFIAEKIVSQLTWWTPGHLIENVMSDKLGIVFLKFDSMPEMLETTDKLQALIKTVVKT